MERSVSQMFSHNKNEGSRRIFKTWGVSQHF